MTDFVKQQVEASARVKEAFLADEKAMGTVAEVAALMVETYRRGGKVLWAGNGGSAADAQHIATEFVSRFYQERPGLNAEALSVNTSTLTAVGNDYSFERVFARQLDAKAHPGDMLIGISTSGRSKNVLEAIRFAKEHGMTTMLLMGDFDTQQDFDDIDYLIKVPSKITARIQEAHIFLGHCLAEYVEHKMFAGK